MDEKLCRAIVTARKAALDARVARALFERGLGSEKEAKTAEAFARITAKRVRELQEVK